MEPRYRPVVISRYIGMYGKNDPTCWAIADREHANRIATSDKFDTYEQAQRKAEEMNK
jgi:hypothetical protein